MELELSDDQQALQESVRAVLERECPISLVRSVVEDHKHAEELWSRMVDLDWPALAVPEEDGGLGLGFVELAVVCEQLGLVICPAPFLATATQFVPALLHAGSTEQRSRFLGAVAQDGIAATLAVAEAAGNFDPSSITTTATPDGASYILDGEKHFVFDADVAVEAVVAARLPGTTGEDGVALFVVPRDSFDSEPMVGLDASRSYGSVVLDSVRVEPDRVLTGAGSAGPVLASIVQEATVALATEMVGTCQAIFDIVHAYVQEREQFGVKVGSFQAIKHKLANMYVSVESARATAYFAAATIAESDVRRDVAVAMAKASVGDCQKLVTTEGIQCLGGIGYTWEHDMHLYVKRAKSGAALFGTGPEHLERLSHLLGL
ncbi:MAG TPA: acyl-CoA dehydrogenase family protein [Acidimicrobiales bacterium]|nr:acyl-CoA dehydrogenase family protein [Acidimicrobiales bacterium]